MSALAEIPDEALIAELARRRPDLIVVPRTASHIMALRGTQATSVFEREENIDFVSDYLDLSEVGKIPGFDDLEDSIDVDERQWLLAAAVWRGCIQGYEEWERLRKRDGDTHFVTSWLKPCVLKEPECAGTVAPTSTI
jgi:hypothetical protein